MKSLLLIVLLSGPTEVSVSGSGHAMYQAKEAAEANVLGKRARMSPWDCRWEGKDDTYTCSAIFGLSNHPTFTVDGMGNNDTETMAIADLAAKSLCLEARPTVQGNSSWECVYDGAIRTCYTEYYCPHRFNGAQR